MAQSGSHPDRRRPTPHVHRGKTRLHPWCLQHRNDKTLDQNSDHITNLLAGQGYTGVNTHPPTHIRCPPGHPLAAEPLPPSPLLPITAHLWHMSVCARCPRDHRPEEGWVAARPDCPSCSSAQKHKQARISVACPGKSDTWRCDRIEVSVISERMNWNVGTARASPQTFLQLRDCGKSSRMCVLPQRPPINAFLEPLTWNLRFNDVS